MKKTQRTKCVFFALLLFLSLNLGGFAQSLEPKFISNAPVGLHFILFAYGYSSGNVLLAPSLPVEDMNANIHSFSLAYATTFGLFGKLAKFDVILPFGLGDWDGFVNGEPAFRRINGFGDPMVRVSWNIIGSPALTGQEYLKYKEKFVMGLSLRIQAPLGQYDETRFINMGTNRWRFAPKLGASYTWGKWALESYVSGWFFTENKKFFNGNTLSQKSIYALQVHVAYTFRPGLWLAVSVGRSNGGETIVNDVAKKNPQNNTRAGAALSIPLKAQHSIKIAFSSGFSTRFGANFTIFVLAYQYRWGGRS